MDWKNDAFKKTYYDMIKPGSQALSQYYSPGGMSEWKRGQMQTRRSATSKSFDDASANAKSRARMSGFGYEQPAVQTDELRLRSSEASDMARIPGDVEAESVPIALNALGIQNQYANTLSGIGSNILQADQAEAERKARLWGGLMGVGSSFIPFIPGYK